ncbi:hypothetical protein PMPD1_2477 [Paramixta manurensis]|uniref:Uncharacterized protein n=1 Tax=Paramixta manurensis TaxID=2740817 RepID=A0A6M8UCG1_9GAMM|nr:hypothetical protein PMPD1_2477 [Erwiniaceae bacterium PD-1]
MNPKNQILAALLAVGVIIGAGWGCYLKGWYAHADHINELARKKQDKAAKAVNAGEARAANANTQAKVIYRTVYRDGVKYISDPKHTNCKFDPAAVQLRQRAIDAANAVTGFDAAPVQGK